MSSGRYRSPAPPSGQRVRVVLWLDAAALADLDVLVAYRHGRASRSAIVREAIDWLRAREAAWLVRAHRQQQAREERERQLREARERPREQRDAENREATVQRALQIASETT